MAQTPHSHLLCSFGFMTFATTYSLILNTTETCLLLTDIISPANIWSMRPTTVNTSYFALLDAEP